MPSKSNGIRVALATCHDKRNFGSMLQAYATQAYLENRGYDVRTIDKTCTLAAARISQGVHDHLELGNLDSRRDWGYAKNYVECMWLILQQEEPEDFVIATGVQHTVRDFVNASFQHVGIDLAWEGEGLNEVGRDCKTGKVLVKVNPVFYRPTERDISDVRDIVRGYRLLIESDRSGEVFNLGSGVATPLRDILDTIIGFAGGGISYEVDSEFFRPADQAKVQADVSKADSELGWSPEISFSQTMRDVYEEFLGRVV